MEYVLQTNNKSCTLACIFRHHVDNFHNCGICTVLQKRYTLRGL